MTSLKNFARQVWDKLVILGSTLYVLLPNSPLNMPFTTRDSGVFLYTGWRILQGDIPYRDIWDHKPPMVFYINAIGLAISGNSRWGVWLIEFICIFLATYFGFRLIKKSFGTVPAIISSFLWLQSFLEMNLGGNFTETYALPLQFICLWLVYEIDKNSSSRFRWFLIGLVSAVAFFTKQTTVGIILAIILYFSYARLRSHRLAQWFYELFALFLGWVFVCAGIIFFFYYHGSLPQFWDVAFKYNFLYIAKDSNFPDRISALDGLLGLIYFTRSGLFLFAATGFILGTIHYKNHSTKSWLPLLSIGLLDLPIEWFMVSSSGRFYEHYYITMLPVLTLFSALAIWKITLLLPPRGIAKTTVILVIYLTVSMWLSAGYYKDYAHSVAKFGNKSVIDYINDRTYPDDYVLIWGAETYINFFTSRRSPTRYVYQYPLYIQGYTNESIILGFLDDIIQNRPKFIIDTNNRFTPIYDFPVVTEHTQKNIAYIKAHYNIIKHFDDWIVYEYNENVP